MNDGATPIADPFHLLRDRRLLRGFTGTFAVNAAGAVILAASAVVFARLLGVEGFGAYSFAIACLDVVAIFAVLGLDKLLIRELATFRERSDSPTIHGLIRFADGISILIATTIGGLFVLMIWWFSDALDGVAATCAYVAAVAFPLRALLWLRRGALVGLGLPVRGQAAMVAVYPGLTLALVVGIAAAGVLGPVEAVGGNVVAAGIACVLGHLWLRRCLAHTDRRPGRISPAQWLGPALAMVAVTGFSIINVRADIVLLGFLRDAEDAGVYAAASRVAEVLRFASLALIPSLGPRFAAQWAAGDRAGLRRSTTHAARFLLAVSAPVALLLVVAAPWILQLFGGDFERAWLALSILAAGHVLCLALGLVDVLALMVGQQNAAALTMAAGAALNIMLNCLLIPSLGIHGAALATAISSIVAATVLAFILWRRLGVNATVFGGRGNVNQEGSIQP